MTIYSNFFYIDEFNKTLDSKTNCDEKSDKLPQSEKNSSSEVSRTELQQKNAVKSFLSKLLHTGYEEFDVISSSQIRPVEWPFINI